MFPFPVPTYDPSTATKERGWAVRIQSRRSGGELDPVHGEIRSKESPTEHPRLGEALHNAIVLADSMGDVAQAAKLLRGAVRRAPDDDPILDQARVFLDELESRLRGS